MDKVMELWSPWLTYHGRAGRAKHALYQLLLFCALYIPLFITIFIGIALWESFHPFSLIVSACWLIYSIPIQYLSILAWIKRFHDMGYSGYTVLILYIPCVNLLITLFALMNPGIEGQNPYGYEPDPNTGVTPERGSLLSMGSPINMQMPPSAPQHQQYSGPSNPPNPS